MRAQKIQRVTVIGINFLRNFGVILVDSFLKPFLPSISPKPLLLGLVRLDDIGDFITWLNGATYIRKYYSDHRIILIGNRSWSDLAKTLPYWDEVFAINVGKLKRNFFYRWVVFRQIRAMRLEMVIQPTHVCCLVTGDSIVRISQATTKIGSSGDTTSNRNGWQKRIANRWYSQLIPASPQPLMVLERNAEFARNLTGAQIEIHPFSMPQPLASIDRLVPGTKYFLVFPGSNGKYKIWPKERFASLTSSLVLMTGYTPIICGAPGEMDLCEWIAAHADKAINHAGKTSLLEVCEMIRNAEFVVGNDSGSIHIAATYNVPSFSILGGGNYGLFQPYPDNWIGEKPCIINYSMPCYGCGWRCYFTASTDSPFPCITNISVDFALESIRKKIMVEN